MSECKHGTRETTLVNEEEKPSIVVTARIARSLSEPEEATGGYKFRGYIDWLQYEQLRKSHAKQMHRREQGLAQGNRESAMRIIGYNFEILKIWAEVKKFLNLGSISMEREMNEELFTVEVRHKLTSHLCNKHIHFEWE